MSLFHPNLFLVQLELTDNCAYLPTASLALSSYLKTKEIDSCIVDLNLFKVMHQKQSNCLALCSEYVSLPVIDSAIYAITLYYGQVRQALRLAKFIKSACLNTTVIFGGPGVYTLETQLLTHFHHWIDGICRGEGEQVLYEIYTRKKIRASSPHIDHCNGLYSIKGLYVWDEVNHQALFGGNQSFLPMDQLPALDYTKVDINAYRNERELGKGLPIIAGSGCPYTCSFCSTCAYWSRKYRVKSVNKILDEMERAYKILGKDTFVLIHDNLFPTQPILANFLKKIGKRPLFYWSAAAKMDILNADNIRQLKQAGCMALTIGVETGSDRVQKSIGKNLDLTAAADIFKALAANHIETYAGFILGFPEERKEDIRQSIDLAFHLTICHPKAKTTMNALLLLNGSLLKTRRAKTNPLVSPALLAIINLAIHRFSRTCWFLFHICGINSCHFFHSLFDDHAPSPTPLNKALFSWLQSSSLWHKHALLRKIFRLEQKLFLVHKSCTTRRLKPVTSIFHSIHHVAYSVIRSNLDIEKLYQAVTPADFFHVLIKQPVYYLLLFEKGKYTIREIDASSALLMRMIKCYKLSLIVILLKVFFSSKLRNRMFGRNLLTIKELQSCFYGKNCFLRND